MKHHWKSPATLAALLVAVAWPVGVLAAERTLTGPEIERILSGATVTGKSSSGKPTKQSFEPGGATTYEEDGQPPSSGRWRVKGDQYCSSWPPSDGWACYAVRADIDANPPTVTWVGESGTAYPGVLLKAP